MQHVTYRRSDPHTCNKCFAPLPPDGICREPHTRTQLPPMVEQGPVPPDLHCAPESWIGRSHTGNLAKPVAA